MTGKSNNSKATEKCNASMMLHVVIDCEINRLNTIAYEWEDDCATNAPVSIAH